MDENQRPGHIVFLNGTSSSGKTSIAKELEMLLDGYQRASADDVKEYTAFIPRNQEPDFSDYMLGFHNYVRDLASKGTNVIVDNVLLEPNWTSEHERLLTEFDATYIGVHCPLDVLLERERIRDETLLRENGAERLLRKGKAESQFDRVHVGRQYNFEVDSSISSPQQCAAQIHHYLQGRA